MLIADGFGALILMQEGRTYCPDLARILDDAAATRATAVASSAFATPPDRYVFTAVLRQRIVNHFNDCNVCDNCRTCDDKRRQLVGPYAPALIPILFAAEFRDRIDEVIRRVTARGHPGETTPGQGPFKKAPTAATAGALLAMTGAAVRSGSADALAGRVQSIVRAVSQSGRTPRWLRRVLPRDPSPRMSIAMVAGAIAAVIVLIVVVAVAATGGNGGSMPSGQDGTGGSGALAGATNSAGANPGSPGKCTLYHGFEYDGTATLPVTAASLESSLEQVNTACTGHVIPVTCDDPTNYWRIPAIVATLATDGWDRIGFNGRRCGLAR